MGKGTLEVHLQGAFGLKNKDFFGKSDPYAVLSCWRQSFRSITAKNQGSNPVWNQKFLFMLEDGVTELFIKLYDQDTFTGDDFIGSVRVPLHRVLEELNHPLASYSVVLPSGKTKGEVQVALTFTSLENDNQK